MNDEPKYDPDIHHRKSVRLKGYDYSQGGLYFITICCHNHKCLFGEIVVAENFLPPHKDTNCSPFMKLNDAGEFANHCWFEIPNHFPDANLHEHIVMPNHIHGIIELTGDGNAGVQKFEPLQKNEFRKVIPHSIGSIVRGYKTGVTKWFRQSTHVETVWQRNYYEHIIRNEKSHQIIAEYIINNPAKWSDDKYYK